MAEKVAWPGEYEDEEDDDSLENLEEQEATSWFEAPKQDEEEEQKDLFELLRGEPEDGENSSVFDQIVDRAVEGDNAEGEDEEDEAVDWRLDPNNLTDPTSAGYSEEVAKANAEARGEDFGEDEPDNDAEEEPKDQAAEEEPADDVEESEPEETEEEPEPVAEVEDDQPEQLDEDEDEEPESEDTDQDEKQGQEFTEESEELKPIPEIDDDEESVKNAGATVGAAAALFGVENLSKDNENLVDEEEDGRSFEDHDDQKIESEEEKKEKTTTSILGENFDLTDKNEESVEGRERKAGTKIEANTESLAEVFSEENDIELDREAIIEQLKDNELGFEERHEKFSQSLADDDQVSRTGQSGDQTLTPVSDIIQNSELFKTSKEATGSDLPLVSDIHEDGLVNHNKRYRTAIKVGIAAGASIAITLAGLLIF